MIKITVTILKIFRMSCICVFMKSIVTCILNLQARRWQCVVEDLRGGRLLDQQLAAFAGPLATNLALHEELRRNDVQAFADVLAHAHHRLTALGRRAVGVFRFDALVHARQVLRQWLAFGLAAGLLVGCTGAWGAVRGVSCGGALQLRELGLQAGLVGGQRLLEDLALLGVHAFGLGTELPGLQPGELERDALDLGVAPLDGLGLAVDALVLLADVSALLTDVEQHLRCECGQFDAAQGFEVGGFDRMHVEHVAIVQTPASSRHWVLFQLPWISRFALAHIRVMHRSCSSRCHGNPSTKALN